MTPDWKTGCVTKGSALKLVTVECEDQTYVDVAYFHPALKSWRRPEIGSGSVVIGTVTAWAYMPEPYRP